MALNFPANPTNGQTYMGYVYSTAVGAWQAKPAAQSPFYTSDTPPANPITGDSWFNTNDGTMYIYVYDGNTYQWVEHRSQIAKSQVGLVPIVPTSVAVGSGTGSVSSSGLFTFNGASSMSMNGVFTSAYKNYVIQINITSGNVASGVLMRMRLAGTDYTYAAYNYAYYELQSGSGVFAFQSATAQTSARIMRAESTGGMSGDINIFSPQESGYTRVVTRSNDTSFFAQGGFGYLGTDQFDGFSIIAASSSIGTMKVYGYN